ncbi:aminotransferase class V-fold PLP-dependent enzyme [Roseomonas sp. GCM10028921]
MALIAEMARSADGDRFPAIGGVRGLVSPQEKERSCFLAAEHGIATRAGPLSAHPLMKHLGVPGAMRASLSLNTKREIDCLAEAVKRFQHGKAR